MLELSLEALHNRSQAVPMLSILIVMGSWHHEMTCSTNLPITNTNAASHTLHFSCHIWGDVCYILIGIEVTQRQLMTHGSWDDDSWLMFHWKMIHTNSDTYYEMVNPHTVRTVMLYYLWEILLSRAKYITVLMSKF